MNCEYRVDVIYLLTRAQVYRVGQKWYHFCCYSLCLLIGKLCYYVTTDSPWQLLFVMHMCTKDGA